MCVFVDMLTRMFVYMCVFVDMFTCVFVDMFTCVCLLTCLHMCVFVDMFTRVFVDMCVVLQEFFGDYIAVGHHLFSFNLPEVCHPGGSWRREEFLRTTDGILSVMLALRKRPVIR